LSPKFAQSQVRQILPVGRKFHWADFADGQILPVGKKFHRMNTAILA
jgi:hypothetical protein